MSPASDDEVPPLRDAHSSIPQTPNSKRASSVISDTPRSIRTEPKANLPHERSIICKEMREEIFTVPHESFLRDYAPWHPSDDVVEACLDKLVKTKVVTEDHRHFVALGDKKPHDCFNSEIAAYKFITDICDAIAKAKIRNRTPCFKMEQKPRSRTASETPGSSHEIDGYFRPLRSTVPDAVESETKDTPTVDSAVNCEWKLESGPKPTLDNNEKAVSAAVHVMNDDVRRMFTYSITIENERMSLWYWSRSHSAKSTWFDFTEDIHTTVGALASFVFAKMDEIGYDPSIQRRLDIDGNNRDLCLIFEVHDKNKDKNRYFKTLHSVAEHLSLRVTGRSTRVFKVIEVGSFDDLAPVPDAKHQILKYVWLDVEAKTERAIQNKIFEDLDKFATKLKGLKEGASGLDEFSGVSPGDQEMLRTALFKPENYKRHFLTIDCDQQGFESKPVSPDATVTDDIFTRLPPATVPASLAYASSSRSHLTSATSSQQPEAKVPRQPREYVPKRQYRVVFNEVCEALQNVRELKTVIRGMQDCLTGLQLMFLAGWVHRDISGGNLLWFSETETEGRGILSDLEYAKKFDANGQGSADPKTGTPFFMAIEIQRHVYIYRTDDAAYYLSSGQFEFDDPLDLSGNEDPVMIHNFEHDLESFFWLLLWTITVRTGDVKTQNLVSSIFHQSSQCSSAREKAITDGRELIKGLNTNICQELKDLVEPVARLRRALMWGYVNRKETFGDLTTYSPLYGHVRKALGLCLRIAEGPGVPPLTVSFAREEAKEVHPLAPQTRKRVRSTTKAGAGSMVRKSQRISKEACLHHGPARLSRDEQALLALVSHHPSTFIRPTLDSRGRTVSRRMSTSAGSLNTRDAIPWFSTIGSSLPEIQECRWYCTSDDHRAPRARGHRALHGELPRARVPLHLRARTARYRTLERHPGYLDALLAHSGMLPVDAIVGCPWLGMVGDVVVSMLVLGGAVYAAIFKVYLGIPIALWGGDGNGKHLARGGDACTRALEAARRVNIEPTEGDRIWAEDRPPSGHRQSH
ncbi:hypothetical protein EVG20_g7659 [Dentipellis fragilis]|uniref:Fungal-type protein kinase domain-containing protein n=1 Tax=Dentipellis fragilis TaxID=205917 RepID=A0A4Y9YFW1_9AGAM|nr:hypothetical protein EVG20_g7659 [Dentipellis fragilis]